MSAVHFSAGGRISAGHPGRHPAECVFSGMLSAVPFSQALSRITGRMKPPDHVPRTCRSPARPLLPEAAADGNLSFSREDRTGRKVRGAGSAGMLSEHAARGTDLTDERLSPREGTETLISPLFPRRWKRSVPQQGRISRTAARILNVSVGKGVFPGGDRH